MLAHRAFRQEDGIGGHTANSPVFIAHAVVVRCGFVKTDLGCDGVLLW